MTRTSPAFPLHRALALALALLAACSGKGGDAPRPLAQLGGELRAAEGGAAQGAVRLALAWYPGLLGDGFLSQPGAVAVQDVVYAGALPRAYTFDVRAAPPDGVLSPMPEGFTGKAAIGILLAYQDVNGNGTLDTIPADGAPIDRVVGSSLEWTTAPAYVVAYLTDDQAPGTGLSAGFNLVQITGAETSQVVPLTTPVPLAISQGGPLLDLFVCEAAWDGSSTQAPCGLELDPPALDANVQGELSVGPDGAEAAFFLFRDEGGQGVFVPDATVTLGGVPVAYDAALGFYHAAGLDPALFEATSLELVATRGGAVLRRDVPVPAFGLTGVPATVTSGAAFDVTWSVPTLPEPGASFDLFLVDAASQPLLVATGLSGPSYRVTSVSHVGAARVTVVARTQGDIPVTVVRTAALAFLAP